MTKLTLGGLIVLLMACLAHPAAARDFGVLGAVFESNGNNGTFLMADLAAGKVTCSDHDGGTVPLSATLLTSGAVDSAEVTLSVGGGEPQLIGVIQPQDFEHDGRFKTAHFSGEISLENGEHDLILCFTQSGAKGRESKRTCGALTVAVDCGLPDACFEDRLQFFGNVVKSPELCGGRGTPHIPVHFRGAPGSSIELQIDGPDGFGLTLPMRRAGDSCIHHALWDTRDGNHAGLGEYTFTALDDGAELARVERTLRCPGPRR